MRGQFRYINQLRIWRERAGYTQQAVAEYLGVDRSTLAYYECGKTQPSAQAMILLCFLYHVSAEEMLRCVADTSITESLFRRQLEDAAQRSGHALEFPANKD